jgi:hypothetical protein
MVIYRYHRNGIPLEGRYDTLVDAIEEAAEDTKKGATRALVISFLRPAR